ncbi:amidohydrolase [Paraglaciecola aestuariivivens]
MNKRLKLLFSFIAVFSSISPTHAEDDKIIAFTGATILPITSAPIKSGTIIIKNAKILALGTDIDIPANATVIDATGKVIMPGIVDTHSHVGASGDTNERSKKLNPELRILDSFNPSDPKIRVALAGGITTVNVMPGSGNVIGGQTIYIKLKGDTVDEMLVPGSIGGMKFANGTNPKGDKAPNTRMATAAMAREAFYQAKSYIEKKNAAEKNRKKDAPDFDLGKEAMAEVLAGKRILHFHSHRMDDIATVLRLKKEFGFRLVIQHGTESYKLAKMLANLDDVYVSHILIDSHGGKHETMELRIDGAAILEKAGVPLALHSDDGVIDSRFLIRTAGLAMRGGLSREGALKSLTINGAYMLDLADLVGSLEAGKDADLAIFDGDPLSLYSNVLETWINGEKVYDRSNPKDRLYATGGYRIADRYLELTEGE